ncbi:MarR family winged helix-turn-helix transcriptional regulator [Microbacterium sp. SSM24]|uniref:MarR family winged helix-turn-helix transcriptional regulator n=1 Tax=Microbacterium sp. SSM24 TaxID=2991714 RepID=UPI002226788F|nr:MarR family transcriptional regulator [Microbacterium sp. SSM24]MCW3492211.1 MarR family transcriptional regulator [Microbacterium sp. SSM24]
MSDRLTFTLHELLAEIDAFADTALQQGYGVTYNHFQFLAVLYDAEPADMTTLAHCLGVTKAAVSKRVPALVADGWITATSQPGAGRSILLSLTPKSTALVHDAGAVLDEAFAEMLTHPALADDPIDAPRLNAQLVALTAFIRGQPRPTHQENRA